MDAIFYAHRVFRQFLRPKGKDLNLEAALKSKNDAAREFIKHVKHPDAWDSAKRVNIKEIKTEQEYEVALDRVDAIFNAKSGTPEGDELALLLLSIEAYEDKNHPVL